MSFRSKALAASFAAILSVVLVEGVRGVHNVNLVEVDGVLHITMHVVMDSEIPCGDTDVVLEEAKEKLASEVGGPIHITIHVEPIRRPPSAKKGVRLRGIEDDVRSIVEAIPGIDGVEMVEAYRVGSITYINIWCLVDRSMPISAVHQLTSEVEHKVMEKFRGSIVTLQTRPI